MIIILHLKSTITILKKFKTELQTQTLPCRRISDLEDRLFEIFQKRKKEKKRVKKAYKTDGTKWKETIFILQKFQQNRGVISTSWRCESFCFSLHLYLQLIEHPQPKKKCLCIAYKKTRFIHIPESRFTGPQRSK